MLFCTASMVPLLLFVAAVSASTAAPGEDPRPGGFTCQLGDSECLKNYLQNDVIARFDQGFPEYGVKSLDPLHYGDITFNYQPGPGMNVTVTHTKPILYGLAKSKVLNVRAELTSSTYKVEASIFTPKLFYEGSYAVSGECMMFPINWNGHFNSSMGDISDTWKVGATLVRKGDDDYLDLETFTFKPKVSTFRTYATGLFWGYEEVGNFALDMINNNWKKLFDTTWKLVEPEVIDSASEAVRNVFLKTPVTGVIQKKLSPYPYNEPLNNRFPAAIHS